MGALARGVEVTRWIDRNLHGLEIATDQRVSLASGCLDMALEHHKAILVLCAQQGRPLYGSAFALLRSIFESYIRGIWLHECATTKNLDDFENDKFHVKFYEMINDLEKLPAYSAGVLSKAKEAGWGRMNSFTHCGIRQVTRRFSATHVEPDYGKEEIREAINFASSTAMLSFMHVACMVGDQQLVDNVLKKFKEFFPWEDEGHN